MSLPNASEFRAIEQRRSLQDLNTLIAAYGELLPILQELGLVDVVHEKSLTPEGKSHPANAEAGFDFEGVEPYFGYVEGSVTNTFEVAGGSDLLVG
jgi:hypothetical protein